VRRTEEIPRAATWRQTWITAPVTLQAKTTIAGFAPGATVLFKYRPVTKAGEGDWRFSAEAVPVQRAQELCVPVQKVVNGQTARRIRRTPRTTLLGGERARTLVVRPMPAWSHLSPARTTSWRKTWSLLVLASTLACGTGNRGQGGGDASSPDAGSRPTPNAFAGQWSCPYTTNSGYMGSTKMVFSENPDGTLSSTSKIQNDDCALKWTVSGSTATALSPQTCGGFTVTSYTFKLEQEQGVSFAVATAVEHGTTAAPDGGTAPVDIAGSFAGFCTKNGTGDAGAPGDGGTPTVCEQDPAVGCGANGVGYFCLGAVSPQSMNPAITCPQLYLGGSSCCTLGPGASTCHPDSAVPCTGSRSGYTCTGMDTPAQAASVVCEPGKAQGDRTTYCCGTYKSPTCTLTGGCGDYAFSCTGTAHPWDSDKSLRCGPANPAGSSTVYCCSVRDPAAPNTCTADSTLPCSPTMGYSCTGTDAPSDDFPGLVCGAPTASQGKTEYCCRM
jgi:hypothetical protein